MSREYCDWHGRKHESMDWQSFRIGGELINVCYRAWGMAEKEELDEAYARAEEEERKS